jgi:hypothetical protein
MRVLEPVIFDGSTDGQTIRRFGFLNRHFEVQARLGPFTMRWSRKAAVAFAALAALRSGVWAMPVTASGSLLIPLSGIYRCNLQESVPLWSTNPRDLPSPGTNPAAALAFVANLAVNATTSSTYSITSVLDGSAGIFFTDASCFVNYVLMQASPVHQSLLPLDYSLDSMYIAPAIAR